MDYRDFELANQRCKPKHFGPPTALQRRLAYDAAHRLPASKLDERPHALAWLLRWLYRLTSSRDSVK
jgi:hypothetical protein